MRRDDPPRYDPLCYASNPELYSVLVVHPERHRMHGSAGRHLLRLAARPLFVESSDTVDAASTGFEPPPTSPLEFVLVSFIRISHLLHDE